MTALLMGTAGHIDHGKTALIRALTGVDLDRLEEEKRRGITIELGFVSLDLGGGERIGVVDVPGHERFVKTMVAGAQGIDMVLLVVAADEGVMPQTVEHLDICRLLGVRKGLIALTKSDRVDEETRMLAAEEIAELVKGTFLEGAPIIPCSAVSGEGIDELRRTISDIAKTLPRRSVKGIFRMPMDRAFSVKGFGTVVTGSVAAGGIAKGDEVEIIPGGKRATVRELEVHGEKVEAATAGQRLAINLSGLDRVEVGRGMWLAKPGAILPTRTVDVMLETLARSKGALDHEAKIIIHAGTAHILAEIDLLGNTAINPGESGAARLHMEKPLALVAGDRFVLRSFARHITVAGGVVLDPLPSERVAHRGRKGKRQAPDFLMKLGAASPAERVEMLVGAAERAGVIAAHLPQRMPITPEETASAINKVVTQGKVVRVGGRADLLVDISVFDTIKAEIIEQIRSFHRDKPMEAGLAKGAIKSKKYRRVPESVHAAALDALVTEGAVDKDGDLIRLRGHSAKAGDADQRYLKAIEDALLKGGNTPPTTTMLMESLGMDRKVLTRLLKFLTDQGRARRVSEELYYHPTAVDRIRQLLQSYLDSRDGIGPVEFKELTGASRKFAIALLEYFDREHVTMRIGDKRVLKKAR